MGGIGALTDGIGLIGDGGEVGGVELVLFGCEDVAMFS